MNAKTMACDSLNRVNCLIDSDRAFVRTCVVLYLAIVVVAVISVFLLANSKNPAIPPYSASLISGLAIPLALKHVQRVGALKVLIFLRDECGQYSDGDPKCQRIWDDVDALLRARAGV
jgi:hypothetical protein